ncbi:fumarylacetoacetate hydrolase family protein [Hoeflea sp. WL0058]|uniref:Fumarylacetoacetate hydrolase family protein n=1 Tax=Flavimaribacter sediminis TaxID=2865987 RepID=A0AAE2ZRZ4_9HYPH|nr:fumarylacetoacetate hydrolase family protein [Flavimaribacter sediminis]MBW8638462.1 fumarylacetoacetate hydrolase family protein [Flavimaribacter sediminis]
MKLGSLKAGGRDGALVIVSRDLDRFVEAKGIAATMQQALDNWTDIAPRLEALAKQLDGREVAGEPFDATLFSSPLPRAYQWADGSAYLSHMRLVRKARGAELPANAAKDPLLYQGGSDAFLAPTDGISLGDPDWGLDFEAEIAVVTDDVPAGVTADQARGHIKLIMLCNDISLRNVMKPELQKGFGFFQSKPASAFSPVCVTPNELGSAWDGGKVSLPLVSTFNGEEFGRPDAGTDLSFDFSQLIAHAAMTRSLAAGTIVGSGTVSNEDYRSVGSSCLQERRMIELLDEGEIKTAFMQAGDAIRIEMFDARGTSIFGAIEQRVVASRK